jgi:glycosyltransferase involved in cell wall biosynthesis
MIKDLLTIVIPCKNEMELIDLTLSLLNKQENISGTKVIIADSSDDLTKDIILSGEYSNLNISIIDGGYPSVARNKGALLCTTPYILFLDADIFLYDNATIKTCIVTMIKESLDLVTCKFRCKGWYSFVFPIFELFRNLSIRYSPCAIGGYMLFKYKTFARVGGFDDEDKFAEDFHLSSKISPKLFKVVNKKIYTTDRRFKKKGLFYMVKVAILSIMNKNNPAFFKYDHNYWL